MAYNVMVEREVAIPRSAVFATLMDFGGIKSILPEMIAKCDCVGNGVGAMRSIELADGGKVVERLEVSYDEKVFAYSITENDALPLQNYFAVVTLADAGSGTKISYGSNWIPNGASSSEIVEMLEGLYNSIIDGIAA